jgi:hypothetical protein
MQKLGFLNLFLIIASLTASAQAQTVDQLIAQLQSPDPNTRMSAFYKLARVGFGSSDQLKVAVIGLLTTENANNTLTPSTIADGSEGYGEYYGDLIGEVARLNDSRSIGALVGAINTGNIVSDAISGFGASALDAVIQQLGNSNVTMRGSAALTIAKMIDNGTVADPTSVAKIRSALNSASLDPDYYTGLAALQGLVKLFHSASAGASFIRVKVDIKPGAYPNVINLANNGSVTVAILGSKSFNLRTIDKTSLKFGPGQASPEEGEVELDDGKLVMQFSIRASQIACTDTAAFLTGETTAGQTIVGSDSILTTGCK